MNQVTIGTEFATMSWKSSPLGEDRFMKAVHDMGTRFSDLSYAYLALLVSSDLFAIVYSPTTSSRDLVDMLVWGKFKNEDGSEVTYPKTIYVQASTSEALCSFRVRVGDPDHPGNTVLYDNMQQMVEFGEDYVITIAEAGHDERPVVRSRSWNSKYQIALGEFAEWFHLPHDRHSDVIDLTKHHLYDPNKKVTAPLKEESFMIVPVAKKDPVRVVCYPIVDEKFSQHVQECLARTGPKIRSLNELMGLAIVTSDYIMDFDDLPSDFGYGVGSEYYDPLARVQLVNHAGLPLESGTTVSSVDVRTNRRLYFTVLSAGKNLIVHDASDLNDLKAERVLIATDPFGASKIAGLDTAWRNIPIHHAMAAKFFGFEFDLKEQAVYPPVDRTAVNPLFKELVKLQKTLAK